MAKKRSNDFVDFLRSQGLRKRVAKALSDLESSTSDARGNAERIGRRVMDDLRNAADEIEKRLNIGGAGTRSAAAKKAAKTRKRATKKRATARKSTTARKTSSARKTTARKSSGGARKTSARKTSARKTSGRKTSARKSSS